MADNEQLTLEAKIAEIKKEFAGTEFCIVHVEDEDAVRRLVAEEVAELGVKIYSASGAREALEILTQRQNQVVLIASDFQMPEVDGYQLREQTLERFPGIPFCIVSAYVNREMALRGVELKISAFIPKPITREKLVDILYKEALPKLRSAKEEQELTLAFVADAQDLLEEAEDILLKLEGPADPESLNRFYAIMHTLKGGAGFCEPKDLHHFVHAYEDILKKLQTAELTYSQAVTNALFNGFDTIKLLFNDIKQGKTQPHDMEALFVCLDLSKPQAEELVGTEATAEGESETTERKDGQKKSGARAKPASQEDIKVSVKLLDEFMQLSGEVTVIRNMLNKCVNAIERRYAGDQDVGMLSDLLDELHKINSGVQSKITEIRKVPLKSVMRPLPRAVRDVTKSLNKKVELEIRGEELRVDASIADVLHNSLLHIIKNSIDHGIEKAEARRAAGKNEIGHIEVEAATRDERVIVSIADDGGGLNVEAIKAKLIKNGTHTKAQVDQMSNPDLYAMIFSSGFSTAQQVTEISGRGVGMSMVKDCVDAIGGKIVITSEPSKGARFQLELPVPKSILIASCLSVKIGQRTFSLVRDDIIRVFQLTPEQQQQRVMAIDRAEFLVFEGELVPIADLNLLLKLEQSEVRPGELRRFILMNNGKDSRLIALEVTEILDVEDMVIKSIHGSLNMKSYYRGVTFLDKGDVGLILNTEGIMNAMKISSRRSKVSEVAAGGKEAVEGKLALAEHNALLLEVEGAGFFALPQHEVFRIEEFELQNMQKSGQESVLPYRDQVMRMVNLSDLIKSAFGSYSGRPVLRDEAPGLRRQFVVVKLGDRFVGLGVERIIDIVAYRELKTDLARPEQGIMGHFFSAERTVALVEVSRLPGLQERRSPTVASVKAEQATIAPLVNAA